MCYLGLDPGGRAAFGWCILDGTNLPLSVLARGIANSAAEAIANSCRALGEKTLCAAAVDAPLFWRSDGDRVVDNFLRKRVIELGGQGGTVNHVNSLRGACLVQGMVAAMLLRQQFPNLPLSESHPKVILWLTNIANAGNPVSTISLADLTRFFTGNVNGALDHERDAALGALSAWAMVIRPQGWNDLYQREPNPVSPLVAPLGYWMPV